MNRRLTRGEDATKRVLLRLAEELKSTIHSGFFADKSSVDGCEFCLGAKGGVPGNENRRNGRVICDYCDSLLTPAPYEDNPNQSSHGDEKQIMSQQESAKHNLMRKAGLLRRYLGTSKDDGTDERIATVDQMVATIMTNGTILGNANKTTDEGPEKPVEKHYHAAAKPDPTANSIEAADYAEVELRLTAATVRLLGELVEQGILGQTRDEVVTHLLKQHLFGMTQTILAKKITESGQTTSPRNGERPASPDELRAESADRKER